MESDCADRLEDENINHHRLVDWLSLPDEVTKTIFMKIRQIELLENVQYVCKQWYQACKNPELWRYIDIFNDEALTYHGPDAPDPYVDPYIDPYTDPYTDDTDDSEDDPEDREDDSTLKAKRIDALRIQAINHSDGNVLGITIETSSDDHFLYVVNRLGSSLKRLTVVNHCLSIHNLDDIFKHLTSLEEFNAVNSFMTEELQPLGKYCRRLHTLRWYICTYGGSRYGWNDDNYFPNAEAFFIAENFPNLRHLSLYCYDELENIGLQAILDKCTQLEFLDLRHCSSLKLRKGSIRKKCKRIKHVWLPRDKWSPGAFDYCRYESY